MPVTQKYMFNSCKFQFFRIGPFKICPCESVPHPYLLFISHYYTVGLIDKKKIKNQTAKETIKCLFQFRTQTTVRCQYKSGGIGPCHTAMLYLLGNISNDGFRPGLED